MCKHEVWEDSIGGVHDEGLGWDPFGEFCGECSRMTCKGCRVFEVSHSKYQVKFAYARDKEEDINEN